MHIHIYIRIHIIYMCVLSVCVGINYTPLYIDYYIHI